ncbi:tetratricopeptide repeat protein [bacterium]|nr:tetratricopeptide repeat protein [candidate division CSSED10-310 bacterium]
MIRPKKFDGYAVSGFVLTICVFLTVVFNRFILLDDPANIYANPMLISHESPDFKAIWTRQYAGMFIPVTYSFWSFAVWMSKAMTSRIDPFFFHLLNLLIHAVNAMLVFSLCKKLFHQRISAFLATLFFAVHPLQVESVAWASGLKDLLCTFFSLMALMLYFSNSVDHQKSTENRHLPNTEFLFSFTYWLSHIFFILALLSKPGAITLPLIVILIDSMILKKTWKLYLTKSVPWIVLSIPVAILTKFLQPITIAEVSGNFLFRFLLAADALSFYIRKTIFPLHLSPDYARSADVLLKSYSLAFTWILPTAVFILFALMKKRKILLTHYILVVVSLLPVLSFVPFGYQHYSIVADRYMVLPLVFIALGISNLLGNIDQRKAILIATPLLLLFSILTFRQNLLWRNSTVLFEYAANNSDNTVLSHVILGEIYEQSGNYQNALQHYLIAYNRMPGDSNTITKLGNLLLELDKPRDVVSMVTSNIDIDDLNFDNLILLGSAYLKLGKLETSEVMFLKALKMNPEAYEVYNNLSSVYRRMKRFDTAVEYARKAIAVHPDHWEPWNNLGNIHFELGNYQEAKTQYERAVELSDMEYEPSINLGMTLISLGDYYTACIYLEESYRKNPNSFQLLANLGYCHQQMGNVDKALKFYLEASLINSSDIQLKLNLASIYLEKEAYGMAKDIYRDILKADPGNVIARSLLEDISRSRHLNHPGDINPTK